MTDRLPDALQVCLLAMETGVALETCLAVYPDLQDELRPALEAAFLARDAALESFPTPAQMRSRTKVLERAAHLGKRKGWRFALRGAPRFSLAGLMVIVLASLGWGGLSAASAASLPGDTLYGVKRWGENLRLNLALSAERKVDLTEGYRERRVDEVRKLLDLARSGAVDFEGQLRRQDETLWFVAEIPVILDDRTHIVGSMDNGVIVEVRGTTKSESGSVRAEEIVLRSLQFVGLVEEIAPEAWTIRGARIAIDALTRIEPGITLHSVVLVRAEVRPDGGLVAQTILSLPEPAPNPPSPPLTATPMTVVATPHVQRIDDFELHGTVDSVGSDSWLIDGRPMKITGETEIGPDIRVGDTVKVEAFVDMTGALTAHSIERSRDSGDDSDGADQESAEDGSDGEDEGAEDGGEGSEGGEDAEEGEAEGSP